LALTRQTIELISDSVPVVASTEAASIFYGELFKNSPALAELFGSQEAQQRKLSGMLKWVAQALADIPQLSEGLRQLGDRHVKYHAELMHFHAVKQAFMHMVTIVDQQTLSAHAEAEGEEIEDGTAPQIEGEEIEDGAAPQIDRHKRLLDVSRAWEEILYVFIGEMSPRLLMRDTISSFHTALANDLATPSSGTCLALAGAQGASLLMMAAMQSCSQPIPAENRQILTQAHAALTNARSALETLAGLDMSAYCRVMAAIRQPALHYPVARLRTIASALEQAACVPLQVAEWVVYALLISRAVLPVLGSGSGGVGDAGAGSNLLLAAGRTSLQNVRINTSSKLASHGWHGWARAVDARVIELDAIFDQLDADLRGLQKAVNHLRDGEN
jgi:formiminotetrahydrofolate cyclodeaminase/hemoglobin-like flavoprotein